MLTPEVAYVMAVNLLIRLATLAFVLLGVYVAVRFAVKHGTIAAYDKIHDRDEKGGDPKGEDQRDSPLD